MNLNDSFVLNEKNRFPTKNRKSFTHLYTSGGRIKVGRPVLMDFFWEIFSFDQISKMIPRSSTDVGLEGLTHSKTLFFKPSHKGNNTVYT